jgi:UDPglucose--hexose-1-phosphate uridylyltransferase
MAKFVPDVNSRRWVVISPGRGVRPHDEEKSKDVKGEASISSEEEIYPLRGEYHHDEKCPFCYGNEHMTPPEVYRWGRNDPHDQNWIVRVVPNKYPITDIHEVIIHSPDHIMDIPQFPLDHIEVILRVYKERYEALKPRGQVIIFNNMGTQSGASLRHPHSQIVVVPYQITLDVLTIEPVNNVIREGDQFVAWAPDFSQFPWEVWIAPKYCCQGKHEKSPKCFFGGIPDDLVSELAKFLQETLQRLLKRFPKMNYNYYIYPGECWYLRIIPRLIHRAGFEMGTGLLVNIADPKDVAEELKNNGGS